MVKLGPHIIAISRAKEAARKLMPYLSTYLEGIPTIFTEDVPTMGVDSCGRLYVNPQWCLQWTDDQNAYVLLHEVLHNLLGHAERRTGFMPEANEDQLATWNDAADLCIQQVLMHHDSLRPGDSVNIADAMQVYPKVRPGMSTEKYFSIMWEDRPKGGGWPTDKDKSGDPVDQPGGGDGEGEGDSQDGDAEDKSGGKSKAKGKGKGKGKQPHKESGSAADGVPRDYELPTDLASVGANMQRLEEVRELMEDPSNCQGVGAGTVKQSLNIRLRRQPDPFQQLKAIVGRATATNVGAPEPTYRKRNRRQECDDLPLRGEFKFNPDCVIIVDTSGSMGCGPKSDRVCRAMTAIAQGLRRVHQPRVIAWDGALQSDARISSLKQFAWQGGGGTSMDAAVVMADTKYKPDAIVLVTDGYTAWPANPTRARLIVALVDKGSTPPKWSKVVDLTKEAPSHVG